MCGEGGEFETLVLDCPLFKKQIVLYGAEFWLNADAYYRDNTRKVIHSDDAFAPVAYLITQSYHLEDGVHSPVSPWVKKEHTPATYNTTQQHDEFAAAAEIPTCYREIDSCFALSIGNISTSPDEDMSKVVDSLLIHLKGLPHLLELCR